MKLAYLLIPGLALLTILGIGCATEKPPESDPLDVAKPPSTTGPTALHTPRLYTPPPAPTYGSESSYGPPTY